jgi:hypothetical protein
MSNQFFQSYLFAYLFWIELALGCFAILMLNHVTSSHWGLITRRLVEAAAMTLPLMALLFVPLIFGLQSLYAWARPEVIASDELLQAKTWYLNAPFFLIRALIYFVVWVGLAYLLNRWSLAQDRPPQPAPGHGSAPSALSASSSAYPLPSAASPYPALARRLWLVSRYGLVLYVLTATFSAFDWGMSLEPDWYSTIYGMMFIVSEGLSALAFTTVMVMLLADRKPLADIITPQHYNDLGNLLLTFVILWAYIGFSQLIIIWYANLPDEIPWYLRRTQAGWQWLAVLLVLFHFVLPFVLLLFRNLKRSRWALLLIAAGIMGMRLVDLFWRIMPAFRQAGFYIHWMDIAALVGIGGLWAAVFLWQLRKRPLLPLYDPRVRGSETRFLGRNLVPPEQEALHHDQVPE